MKYEFHFTRLRTCGWGDSGFFLLSLFQVSWAQLRVAWSLGSCRPRALAHCTQAYPQCCNCLCPHVSALVTPDLCRRDTAERPGSSGLFLRSPQETCRQLAGLSTKAVRRLTASGSLLLLLFPDRGIHCENYCLVAQSCPTL